VPDEDMPPWFGECSFIEKGILPAQVRAMSLGDRRNLGLYFKGKAQAAEEKKTHDKWRPKQGFE
jgi:hypothetical protein